MFVCSKETDGDGADRPGAMRKLDETVHLKLKANEMRNKSVEEQSIWMVLKKDDTVLELNLLRTTCIVIN